MATVKTKEGVEIFYKDWGPKGAQPIVFHHGWPLSSDDWDAPMLFFVAKGYRDLHVLRAQVRVQTIPLLAHQRLALLQGLFNHLVQVHPVLHEPPSHGLRSIRLKSVGIERQPQPEATASDTRKSFTVQSCAALARGGWLGKRM